MSSFLSWLYNQASMVYAWFSSSFWTFLSTVQNTWTWISNKATDTYNRATAWAKGEIDKVQANLTNTINWASQAITDARNYALNLVNNVGSTISSGLKTVESYALGLVNGAIATLRGETDTKDGQVQSQVQGWVPSFVTDALRPFAWLLDLRQSLTDLLTTLTPATVTQLKELLSTTLANVKSFFQDPVTFIFGVIWSSILDFLGYKLATAFGTLEAELPPPPTWGTGGGAGGGGPTAPPGTVGAGLYSPLTYIYLSGYSFSSQHPGADFGILDRQPVFAAHEGEVREAGWSAIGFGFTVTIQGTRYWSRYGHLSQVLVSSGQRVEPGTLIAYGNSTGNSTGPHLHFELRDYGVYVDPLSVIGPGGH